MGKQLVGTDVFVGIHVGHAFHAHNGGGQKRRVVVDGIGLVVGKDGTDDVPFLILELLAWQRPVGHRKFIHGKLLLGGDHIRDIKSRDKQRGKRHRRADKADIVLAQSPHARQLIIARKALAEKSERAARRGHKAGVVTQGDQCHGGLGGHGAHGQQHREQHGDGAEPQHLEGCGPVKAEQHAMRQIHAQHNGGREQHGRHKGQHRDGRKLGKGYREQHAEIAAAGHINAVLELVIFNADIVKHCQHSGTQKQHAKADQRVTPHAGRDVLGLIGIQRRKGIRPAVHHTAVAEFGKAALDIGTSEQHVRLIRASLLHVCDLIKGIVNAVLGVDHVFHAGKLGAVQIGHDHVVVIGLHDRALGDHIIGIQRKGQRPENALHHQKRKEKARILPPTEQDCAEGIFHFPSKKIHSFLKSISNIFVRR